MRSVNLAKVAIEAEIGVVQIRVTLEAREPLAGAALARSSVTRKQHFLNHASSGLVGNRPIASR
jgi:hypothetical protein